MSPVVDRQELRLGSLLAEGGEGRVFELADRPGLLFKAYRHPAPLAPLAGLIDWLDTVRARGPELARRVEASAAWPSAVVVAGNGAAGNGAAGNPAAGNPAAGNPAAGNPAAGLLLPRAPRRFSLRHRDGSTHLATLSYLTAAPGQRAAAYGLALPPPMAPERLGIVYALARLLEALQSAAPAIGHGDLSTKNVLWSLERGPEVFLLDCDSAERYGPSGAPLDAGGRRRAMTPNWDDPAIAAGDNPTFASDRYSLALIFLRVAGAAHFPIQGRQRRGEPLHIDFDLPPGVSRARSLDTTAALWDLCERSLTTAGAETRPPAPAWAAALEEVLDDLGAMDTVRAVWAAQGGGAPGPTPPVPAARSERAGRTVTVVPVAGVARTRTWEKVVATPAPPLGPRGLPGPPRAVGRPNPLRAGGLGPATITPSPVVAPGPPLGTLVRAGLRRAGASWLALHRRMARTLMTRRRRVLGVFRLLGCVGLDLMVAIGVIFVVAMLVSPFLRL